MELKDTLFGKRNFKRIKFKLEIQTSLPMYKTYLSEKKTKNAANQYSYYTQYLAIIFRRSQPQAADRIANRKTGQ
jgi:hypothetical protein